MLEGENVGAGKVFSFTGLQAVAWIVVIGSLLSCLCIAVVKSKGLTSISVKAHEQTVEPLDHRLMIIKKEEALPDYELILIKNDGDKVRLGAKPNTSAKEGLVWNLSEAIPVHEISSIRLQDQDKLVSDAIVEVEIKDAGVVGAGYEFQFATERSFDVAVTAFFSTPIGIAISVAFGLAVLMIIFGSFSI
ncbi:hypothetical protein SAMN02745181_2762 [Rubritalea squalenifaciens DSM 18772]|uniref:Uncharacterized protein n=1 Tax=Rubritalea squalenifaciens DSM 18772 TaxID=1123071 RepID=A0A1M6N7L3_9BACT|nr:hypothetical protein [Rubritalea squalenifaciens]SHJ91594.1 hypothetical protein SAMN02745181_2762 [Rubritalea squalenifaciens DSM 18772]